MKLCYKIDNGRSINFKFNALENGGGYLTNGFRDVKNETVKRVLQTSKKEIEPFDNKYIALHELRNSYQKDLYADDTRNIT
jgi:hypothetical protein